MIEIEINSIRWKFMDQKWKVRFVFLSFEWNHIRLEIAMSDVTKIIMSSETVKAIWD